MNRKQIRAAALLAAFLFLLPGCGKGKEDGEEAVKLPEEYSFEGTAISALATEEEGVQFSQAKTVTYFYNGLSEPGKTASSYTSQLTSDGYTVVDEELVKTDRPDFSTAEGTLSLAKAVEPEEDEEGEEGEENQEEQEPKVILIVLTWSEDMCSVIIDEKAGEITYPPPPESSTPAANISLAEALDYIRGLQPSVLGLGGDSMESYQIYAQEGTVLVEGRSCLRLNVYSTDNPAHTNEFMGSFLMTGDGRHLYRSDAVAGTVEELELP